MDGFYAKSIDCDHNDNGTVKARFEKWLLENVFEDSEFYAYYHTLTDAKAQHDASFRAGVEAAANLIAIETPAFDDYIANLEKAIRAIPTPPLTNP